jgi:hypothetical protein
MHLRLSRVTRNGRTAEYAQLVESFRRESDGMPMHRVVAHLGKLSPIELDNLRAALKASRSGRRVVSPAERIRAGSAATPIPQVAASLRYLDLAVLLALWHRWELDRLIDELIPGETEVPASGVIAALVLQRCAAPDSKLAATLWFPRTALPELLNIAPSQFNNTRVHRVLDELDGAGRAIMGRLPARYLEREGRFLSLFLDVSDAWFVGHGPELARHGKTKEGMIRRKIGIVLLCNERGYPLRWEVVEGCAPDNKTMLAVVDSVAGLGWVGEAPLVCDRSMGRTATIQQLATTGVRFLTALTVTEFGSYTSSLPTIDLDFSADELAPKERATAIQQAAQLAEVAGMTRAGDDLLVKDFGLIERVVEPKRRSPPRVTAVLASDDVRAQAERALRIIHQVQVAITDGRYPSLAASSRAAGISKDLASKYVPLTRLPADVQQEILDGKAAGRAIAELLEIAKLDDRERQREAFHALLQKPPPRLRVSTALAPIQPGASSTETRATSQEPLRVRVVAYFNPERFIEQRLAARRRLAEVRTFVDELNAKLARTPSKWSVAQVTAAIDRHLRSEDLLAAFTVSVHRVEQAGAGHLVANVTLVESEWKRRHRYDGFTVLVAHPKLAQPAVELAKLYRAKDVVEQDFRTIKSAIELRPVWHRTDGKVRAHVTLCMLALLLERTLEHLLQDGHRATSTLELLEPCRLNQYRLGVDAAPVYTVTQPDTAQRRILRALQLEKLVDADEAAANIHSR